MIDLEAAAETGNTLSYGVATPGFVPHVACGNEERDAYGIAAIVGWLLWPSYSTSFLPSMLLSNRELAARYFSQPTLRLFDELIRAVPERLLGSGHGFTRVDAGKMNVDEITERIAQGIRYSRRAFEPEAACYPGDVTQLTMQPGAMLDIETGAAGVLLMLDRAGYSDDSGLQWLLRNLDDISESSEHGLLRGRAGIASALAQLGEPNASEKLLSKMRTPFPEQDLSLRSGVAGTVLSLVSIQSSLPSRVNSDRLEFATRCLRSRIVDNPDLISPFSETGNAIGLFDGWSGVAVVCHQLAELLGESEWRELMRLCIERDLENLRQPDGSIRVDYSGVNFGYLSEGSAGVLFALLLCDEEGRYTRELELLRQSTPSGFTVNGGLFRGAAGIAAVRGCYAQSTEKETVQTLSGFLLKGHLFAPPDADALLMLGDNTLHLSADYSTGAAGVLGALVSIYGKDPLAWFPVPLMRSEISRMDLELSMATLT